MWCHSCGLGKCNTACIEVRIGCLLIPKDHMEVGLHWLVQMKCMSVSIQRIQTSLTHSYMYPEPVAGNAS
jgi:hypothetical protein